MSENMDSPDVDLKDANPVDDGAGKSFTQAEVDKIIEQRLSRERKRFDKATEGIDLNEAKQLMEQRDQLELERKKDRGEFEDVLKTTVAKKKARFKRYRLGYTRFRLRAHCFQPQVIKRSIARAGLIVVKKPN